jgi:acyl-CoA synthetase (AMP-forming)/AMP-acid ligase II
VDQHIAANRGDQAAFRYGDRRYSFHDLAALTNRGGNLLRRSEVGRGTCVALLLPPSPAFFAALFGAIKIGAVPLISEGHWGSADLGRCLTTTTPALAVVEQARVPEFEAAPGAAAVKAVVVGADPGRYPSFADLLREMPSSLAPEPVGESAPALLVYADGKAGAVTHGELAAALRGPGAAPAVLGATKLLGALRQLAAGSEVAIPR